MAALPASFRNRPHDLQGPMIRRDESLSRSMAVSRNASGESLTTAEAQLRGVTKYVKYERGPASDRRACRALIGERGTV